MTTSLRNPMHLCGLPRRPPRCLSWPVHYLDEMSRKLHNRCSQGTGLNAEMQTSTMAIYTGLQVPKASRLQPNAFSQATTEDGGGCTNNTRHEQHYRIHIPFTQPPMWFPHHRKKKTETCPCLQSPYHSTSHKDPVGHIKPHMATDCDPRQ